MTKFSIKCSFGNSCDISIENTTGMYPSNADGFLPENKAISWTDTTHSKSFKLSEVWFFTAVVYNAYGKTPTVENVLDENIETPIKIIDEKDYPTKINKKYTLDVDGFYTIGQFIAFDKSYYETNKASKRFLDVSYIVYDESVKLLYHALNGVYTALTVVELLDDHLTQIDHMRSFKKVVSTCKIYNCYMDQMENFIPSILNKCATSKYTNDYNNVLLIYTVLKSIEYRVYLCDYNTAQKYIEWINSCSGVCGQLNKSATSTCKTCS